MTTLPQRRGPPTGVDLALVLGAGGAKGLGHIVVLEVLDDMGLVPKAIAGTSIGAIIGACRAAGMSGREIRAYILDVFANRPEVFRRLMSTRVGKISQIFTKGLTNPVLVDAERVLGAFLPAIVPDRFEALAIPLTVVATDFHEREEVAFRDGPLLPAVAASIAIPGVLRPVSYRDRVLIDGGVVNPVPVSQVKAAVVIAVDVLDGSEPVALIDRTVPDAADTFFGAVNLMMQVLTDVRLSTAKPTVHIRPPVGQFRTLDFFRARDILAAVDTTRDLMKRRIAAAIEASPAELLEPPRR
jgi:NTE family protein